MVVAMVRAARDRRRSLNRSATPSERWERTLRDTIFELTNTVPMNLLFARTILLSAFVATGAGASAQWQQVGPNGSAYGIVAHNGALYAGMQGDSIRRSIDHGSTWTAVNTGITEPSNWWLASAQGVLFCGTQFGAAFRSADDGTSWQNIGLDGARGFVEHNDTLYACQWYNDQVQFSTDAGLTWQPTATVTGPGNLWPLISANGSLFVGGQTGGIQHIAHSADTWTTGNTGLVSTEVYAFAVLGNVLFAGTGNSGGSGGGVFRSVDNGATWSPSGVDGHTVYALHAMDSLLFAGTYQAGVFMSTDTGATWTAFNNGLTNQLVARITDDGEYLYAGTLGNGVYRYGTDSIGQAIGEHIATDALSVYPVPASDRVNVQWTGHRAVSYLLRTASGAVAQRGNVTGNGIAMDALPPGLYFLEVHDGKGAVRMARVVKD